jgi:hypothetical protein
MEVLRSGSPNNVFNIALGDGIRTFHNMTKTSLRPIDVLYTSSHCDTHREKIVHVIRKKLEGAGLRFEFNGKCNAGSLKPRYKFAPGDEPALEAKMMIAIPRSQDLLTYALDEKLSKAMKYGCIPIYKGVGQHLAQDVNRYPSAYFDRKNYSSDDEFAHVLTIALKDLELLDSMQHKLIIHQWGNLSFCPPINKFVLSHPPVWMDSDRVKRHGVSVAKNDGIGISNHFLMQIIECAFNNTHARKFTWVHWLQNADIEINHCCF